MIGNTARLAAGSQRGGQGEQSPAPFGLGMDKDFYKVFSRIFHMPDREFARYLRSGFLGDIQFLEAIAVWGFRQFLDEHGEKDDESFFNCIAVEYTRLFVNAMRGVPCPPYESMYRENTIMGESTLAVLERYKEAGLQVIDNFHDLPDHIAVELEFLYFLLAKGDRVAHDAFLRDHLSKWVSAFSEAIERSCQISFYRHAATVLAQTITAEV